MASEPSYRDISPNPGLSHERWFRRVWLVGLGGRPAVTEGDGEGVDHGLPAHRPPGAACPGRVQAAGDKIQALQRGLLAGKVAPVRTARRGGGRSGIRCFSTAFVSVGAVTCGVPSWTVSPTGRLLPGSGCFTPLDRYLVGSVPTAGRRARGRAGSGAWRCRLRAACCGPGRRRAGSASTHRWPAGPGGRRRRSRRRLSLAAACGSGC